MTKSWADIKPEACRLYIQEGRTLSEVRASLEESFNFKASARAFRLKFKEWGITRTSRLRDLQAQDQRAAAARGTSFGRQESNGSIPEVTVLPQRSLSEPMESANITPLVRSPISSTPTLAGSPNYARSTDNRSGLLHPSQAHEPRSARGRLHSAYQMLRRPQIGRQVRQVLAEAISSPGEDYIIHYAAQGYESWTLEYIIDYMQVNDISIDVVDSRRRTALELAMSAGQYDAVQVLLEHGASILLRNNSGQQPLHYAIMHHASVGVVELLLLHGADIDAPLTRNRGQISSPIQLCVDRVTETPDDFLRDNVCAIFDALLKHGAHFNEEGPNTEPTHTTFLGAWLRWEATHTFTQWNKTKCSFRLSHYLRAGFDPLCWFPCSHCPGNECNSLASYVFAHTPNSGLAELLIQTVDVEQHGDDLLYTLLSPCRWRSSSRTDTPLRELFSMLLRRMGKQGDPKHAIDQVLDSIARGSLVDEELDLVKAVMAWEVGTTDKRREALKQIPRMDPDSGLRLAEILLSGPKMEPTQLWKDLISYFFGSGRVILRNRVRAMGPELQNSISTALRIDLGELGGSDTRCMIRCVIHVFTKSLMEITTNFDMSTQQRISGSIDLRQEYDLPLLPVSGELVLAMYPHLDRRRRMGRTSTDTGQNGFHDDAESTLGDGTDTGGASAYATPRSLTGW